MGHGGSAEEDCVGAAFVSGRGQEGPAVPEAPRDTGGLLRYRSS